jgi:hypothetical protein
MNAVVAPTGLILATWAREDEDPRAAPCAYKRRLRRAAGRGFRPLLLQEAARDAQRAPDWCAYQETANQQQSSNPLI